jgi:hypothetical protein
MLTDAIGGRARRPPRRAERGPAQRSCTTSRRSTWRAPTRTKRWTGPRCAAVRSSSPVHARAEPRVAQEAVEDRNLAKLLQERKQQATPAGSPARPTNGSPAKTVQAASAANPKAAKAAAAPAPSQPMLVTAATLKGAVAPISPVNAAGKRQSKQKDDVGSAALARQGARAWLRR